MVSRRQFLGALALPALLPRLGAASQFGDAEAYERFMGRWSRLLAPLLVEFAGIGNGGTVLDVGSGTGSLASTVLRLRPNCSVVGIDPSREYVAYALAHQAPGARAAFEVGDAQALRFADATFENSLSLLVFNFIPDPLKALREVRRVTKAGGRVAAAVWDYGADMKMLRLFWDAAATLDPAAGARDEKHMPLCRAGELAALWRQGGMKDVDERPLGIAMRFQNFDDFWQPFLLKQGPAGSYVAGLGQQSLQALRSEVKRRLGVRSESASLSLPARAWAVRGTV